jgi:UDP:flavonoid glycosyltransferase YjiC (YdhE family)
MLGWELGGNRGHAEALKAIALALIADGHDPVIAAKEPLRFTGFDACPVMQAPIWPGMLVPVAAHRPGPPVSMADILTGLGILLPGALASLIRSWDAVFGAFRPDVVIGDFAPALFTAARGRIRTISTGSGFCQPPADMSELPDLLRASQAAPSQPLLAAINAELAATGRTALAAAPELFAADHIVVSSFAEFDPYRRWRKSSYAMPSLAPLAAIPEQPGDEVFVYYHRADPASLPLWEALAKTGLTIRTFVGQPSADGHAALTALGILVERNPLSWEAIASRSRVVVSHGGLGFSSGAVAMGLPHLVLAYDLEKILTGLAVRQLGAGDTIMPHLRERDATEQLLKLYADERLRNKTRAAAVGMQERIAHDAGQDDVTVVRRLVAKI